MLIAIDTSTDTAGLALAGDDGLIAEFTWRSGQNHSVQLLPNLAFMLGQAKLDLSQANGIIVARGPGGYNGLRAGLSAAKSLAFCLGIPLAGISTLEAIAFEHAAAGVPVCPVINSGGGEIAAAIFEMKSGEWIRSMPEQLISVNELNNRIGVRTLFCGQVTDRLAATIKTKLGDKAVIPSPSSDWNRTGSLAELGRRRFACHDFDDPASLQPLYLRGPAITTPKRK